MHSSQHNYNVKMRGSKPASQHHCNAKTQGLKPMLSKARSPLLSKTRSSRLAKLETRVSAQSLKPASQTRSSTQRLKLAFQHHHGAQTRSSRPASSVTSSSRRKTQDRVQTTEELCFSIITTSLLSQVGPRNEGS